MGIAAFSTPVKCDLCKTEYPNPELRIDYFGYRTEYDNLRREMLSFPERTSSFSRYRKLIFQAGNSSFEYRCDNCIGEDKEGFVYRKEGFICHNY
ncbi:MAG: hypothetical protein AAB966_00705 [Patescibacteria group bacterium]